MALFDFLPPRFDAVGGLAPSNQRLGAKAWPCRAVRRQHLKLVLGRCQSRKGPPRHTPRVPPSRQSQSQVVRRSPSHEGVRYLSTAAVVATRRSETDRVDARQPSGVGRPHIPWGPSRCQVGPDRREPASVHRSKPVSRSCVQARVDASDRLSRQHPPCGTTRGRPCRRSASPRTRRHGQPRGESAASISRREPLGTVRQPEPLP